MPEQLKSGGQGSTIGVPGSADSYKQIERPIRSSTPTASTATPSGPGTGRVATPTEVHEIQFKERMQPVDTNTIRQQAVAELDGQIKAIQQQAAEQVREEQQAGQEREGRTRAIQARRGLVGSDFGDAQTTQTKQFTQKNIDLINQQKNVQIAAVFDKIDQRAQERIEAEKNRVLKAEDDYFAYLQTKKEEAKEDVKTLASTGITLEQLDPADKQDLMEQAGYDNELMFDLYYNSNLPQADRIEWKSEKLADGSIMFWGQDPVTGQIKQQKAEFDVAPQEDIQIVDGVAYGSSRDANGNLILRPLTVKEDKLLSLDEARQLGVPFGTTVGQAGQMGIIPDPEEDTKEPSLSELLKLKESGYEYNAETGELTKVEPQLSDTTKVRLENKVKAIDNLLKDSGMKRAVGTYGISRWTPFSPDKADVQNFIASVNNLIDTETLDTLIKLKEAGGTLGAISEKELAILQSSATKLSGWAIKNDNDKVVGYEISEEKFKEELNRIKESAQRVLDEASKIPETSSTNIRDQISDAESNGYSPQEVINFLNNKPELQSSINTAKEAGYSDQEIIEFLKGNDLSRSENYSSVDKIAQAIGQYESGGNYQARGPVVTSGQYKGERALGKYQIMPGNLPSWSMAALGREVSEQEFLNSPEIQDSIAQYKMNEIYKKYGTVEDVASVWFSGQPVARAGNAQDVLGTSVPQYVKNIVSIHNRLS